MAPSDFSFSWHYKVSQDECMPLPEAASDKLEDAYGEWLPHSSPNQVVRLRSGRYEYEVNFTSMTQRNVSTCKTRTLVRRESRLGQELTRCQALLQQANANLKREVSEKSKEFERKEPETSVAQEELARCQALLQHEQQANENLKREMAEKDNELERCALQREQLEKAAQACARQREQLEKAAQACEQQREQLEKAAEARQRTWEEERAALQTTLASSQKQASECEVRVQQLKTLLVQQQQAALKSDEELREARTELERLGAAAEGHCTETTQLRAELEALRAELEAPRAELEAPRSGINQWQFLNHFDEWQPYSSSMGRDMDALFQQWSGEGRPNKVYRLSDRYEVNFEELWQENAKHGKRRPIRRQLGTVLEGCAASGEDELATSRGQLQLQQEHAHKEARFREELESRLARKEEEMATVHQQLQEKQEQLVELDTRLAGQEAQFREELESRLARKEEAMATVHQQLQEKQEQLVAGQEQEQARMQKARNRLQELTRSKKELEAKLASAEERATAIAKDQELARLEMQDRKEEASELRKERDQLQAQQQKDKNLVEELRWKLARTEQRASRLPEVPKLERDLQRLQAQQQDHEKRLQERDEKIKGLSTSLENARAEAKTALKKAAEANTAKESAKEKQVQVQREMKEKSAQLKRMHEQHPLLVASVLTTEFRSQTQARMASSLSREDDALLRRTDEDLVDAEAKKMLEESARMRKQILNLSPTIIDVFGELREPDASQEVVETGACLDVNSADFRFIEHLFQRSLTSHRASYHSEEWCEKPKLRVVSIELLTMAPKKVNLYRNERDRIGKRDLPETPFPMEGAVKPVVAKDANEFMLFHGCPWESVASICSQGFDWKFRGSNQGCMFGQGVYFGANASKCDIYSDCDAKGQKCMFLARVLLGASVPRWRGCANTKCLGKDRDSVCAATRNFGGAVDHPEVCIMQKAQALPAAKIVYVHQDGCACHRCRTPMSD